MHLYVVRHGHKANQEPDYNGGFNTPLSERGKEQARHVAAYFADIDLDAIYTSCQLRALQTAQPVSERCEAPWHVWPSLCEVTGTRLADRWQESSDGIDGLASWPVDEAIATPSKEQLSTMDGHYYTLREIPDRFPGAEVTQPFPFPEAWWVPCEGQTYETGFARVELGAEAIRERHERNESVAVICHNGSANMFVTTLMGYPREPQFPIRFGTAGITRLDLNDDGNWRIGYANRRAHLPEHLQL